MFNLADLEEEDDGGSEDRYHRRIEIFKNQYAKHPRLEHHAFWVIHNCVAHPFLGLLPRRETVQFHTLTSNWLHRQGGPVRSVPVPKIPKRAWWVFHNVIAHVAIGLVPTKATFRFHDWSAEKMGVDGWV